MKASTALRRAAERKLRREHILLAAERVFSQRHFDDASMQQIASEAGIGMHGLYQQFASKEELYEEILLTRVAEIRDKLAAVLAQARPADRLELMAQTWAGHFFARPQFFPVWMVQRLSRDWGFESRLSKSADRCLTSVEEQVGETIAAAVEGGALRPLEPRLLTRIALAVFGAVVQEHLLRGPPFDVKACAAEMLDAFFRGVGTPARRRG